MTLSMKVAREVPAFSERECEGGGFQVLTRGATVCDFGFGWSSAVRFDV